MYLIGVDIGGTNLKIGLIKNKTIVDKIVEPTDKDDVVNQVKKLVNLIISKYSLKTSDIQKLGVGCPGIVIDGIIKESANLKLFNCNLVEILTNHFGIKTYVKNDADMAVLAEHTLGAGKGYDNVILITIGTGIGGGIIINNKLYTGTGGAGELGHVTMYNGGIACNCGRRGCAEKYLSAIALSLRAKETISTMPSSLSGQENITASSIEKAYLNGDECAKKIVDEYTYDLSEYLLNLCNVFRPNAILIGGGLSYAPKIIEKTVSLCKNKHFGYKNSNEVLITSAKLGNDAGILGVVSVNWFLDILSIQT